MAQQEVTAVGKSVPSAQLVSEFASNGSTIDAIGDYAAAMESFRITCKAGIQKLHIHRMIVNIEDVGNFDAAKYGNNITLTNGINVCVRNAADTILVNLTGTAKVQTNAQWAAYCHDAVLHNFGVGNQSLTVRWTFANMGKAISLSAGEYLSVELNDNFDGLVHHNFMLQGHYA